MHSVRDAGARRTGEAADVHFVDDGLVDRALQHPIALPGARTGQAARHVQQEVFEPFERRRRVFAPSSAAFAESGRVLAAFAAREGWPLLDERPSLLNDALIAVSCRERGITLITKHGDFRRLSPFVKGFRYAAPWPVSVGATRAD